MIMNKIKGYRKQLIIPVSSMRGVLYINKSEINKKGSKAILLIGINNVHSKQTKGIFHVKAF